GSFQIDGPGQMMIEHLEGDWTGVVGLPVFVLGELLKKAEYDVLSC
ncbi:Maf family protein, partial [Candidatus Peregrinibacteria bacterium]|nr:Maf family protein [Candidatus Peregrinibacteria bacterium]